ncbi:hypothetical protein [Pendulispora albinea]|uniref:Uncharacterized protein n=1 Tax=Pendulispora albinea TaxID=2741071 RepID=A0ABZ2LKW6_9BACT
MTKKVQPNPAGEVALNDEQLDDAKGGIAPTGCVRGPAASMGIRACKGGGGTGQASHRLICTNPWRPGKRYKLW